jgi:signal transduction histidine kinase
MCQSLFRMIGVVLCILPNLLPAQAPPAAHPPVFTLLPADTVFHYSILPEAVATFMPHHWPIDSLRHQRFVSYTPQIAPPTAFGRTPVDLWIGFGCCNRTADTVTLYHCVGIHDWSNLYECHRTDTICHFGGKGFLRDLPLTNFFLPMRLPPGDTVWGYFGLSYGRAGLLDSSIKCVSAQYVEQEGANYLKSIRQTHTTGIIMVVSLCFMGLFFALQYTQSKYAVQAWYTAYLWSMGLFFLFHFERNGGEPVFFSYWPRLLTSNELPLIALTGLTYTGFVYTFFNLPHTRPRRAQWLRAAFVFNMAWLLLVVFLEIFFYWENYAKVVFPYGEFSVQLVQLSCLFIILPQRGRAEKMVVGGMFALLIGSFVTGTLSYETRVALFGQDHLILLKIGVLIEILLFATALGIKIQQDQIQHALLRERIARDLHDEMGSTLSSISILSAAALHHQQPETEQAWLSTIGERARDVMESMSDIVWSVNPRNDSMENILERMKIFATELLEARNCRLHFDVEPAVLHLNLSMERRKNFYLIFKEAVNNAAKYAEATEVWVTISNGNHQLRLEIRDNGRGFDLNQVRPGNGQRNMQQRAEQMGGTLTLKSKPGMGVCLTLLVPIT